MDPIIRTVRTPEKSAPLVLRKAALAPIAVLVGAARMKPPPLIEEMTPEHPAPERVAPTEPPPTVDDSARIEAALEEARKLGYAEGFASGAEEAKRALAEQRAALERLLASLDKAYRAALEGVEDVALAITGEAVCKILGETAATGEGVRAIVGECTRRLRAEEKLLVRLCPADLKLLKEGDREAASETPTLEFLPDASIQLGGCIVETGAGRIDATLETQLGRLRETLLATRRARQSGEQP